MNVKYADRYNKIGRNIAYYRNKTGLSQQQLSDMVNISKSYLSKIEAPKSEKSCSLEVLFDISSALDIDISALFNEPKEEE